jgi:DNA-binding MarR family transcriptional regulator
LSSDVRLADVPKRAASVGSEAWIDSDVVDALESLVVGAVGLTAIALGRLDASRDLTITQWRSLVVVSQTDGVHVGEIAARVHMSIPSASRLIRRLEDRGLVSTARDEGDRRRTIVRPTTAGHELWQTVVRERRRLIADVLKELPERTPAMLLRDLGTLKAVFERFA